MVAKIGKLKQNVIDFTTRSRERSSSRDVTIKPPKFETAKVRIRGQSPYVQLAFSQKDIDGMIATQEAGQQAKSKRKREPKNFKAKYEAAKHISRQGWIGMPASAFRNAMISACRTVGFKMTLAKLSLFVDADGFDRNTGDALVRITKGKPRMQLSPVRNANGAVDIRARALWVEGWEAIIRIRWDAEQFSASDVVNLLARVGQQVGIGEGRADSRNSAGVGWGFFEVVN